jgi:PucR C-terminal helix-turn-helix domain
MDWLRPELPAIVDEVIAAVQQAVPAYRVLDANVRTGVRQALEGFIELREGKASARLPARDVYVRFGRGEARSGRPLDALLQAYRVGAQAAWRGLAAAGDRAGVEPRTLYELAEAIFAYIDGISAASADGHAFEQSLAARGEQERRRRVVEALLAEPQASEHEIVLAARAAAWELPERLAVLAFDPAAGERVAARLPAPALVAGGWALVVDPDGPGRHDELRSALRDTAGALGPAVGWRRAAESAQRARLALEAVGGEEPLVVADEHLLDLILTSDPTLSDELVRRRLAPLDELPPRQRERLLETLAAWLDSQGEARPAAERLHVHVQTVRYRLGRLRDVLGDALDDPVARLELALALRLAARH